MVSSSPAFWVSASKLVRNNASNNASRVGKWRSSVANPTPARRAISRIDAWVPCSVSNEAERGTLDIVFANAGVESQLWLGEITAQHFDETFDVNVEGTIFTVQKAPPLMSKGGSIILTGSSAGTTGAPAFTAYSASKAAVRNLARTWAEDLKGIGIRVNVLSPGAIATELATEALGEAGLKAYGSWTAFQPMGDPVELGAVATSSPRQIAPS